MFQLPVRAKSVDPANLGTADISLICHCDDGSDYAVKNATSGAHVAHSEWFCKHLGDRVGIASPECRWVEVNGEVAFGSRWESAHEPNDWWLRAKDGRIEKDRVCPTLSRIFAFDLFVNNEDRHLKNYIVRPQVKGWSVLAFDYSRAWIATGWPLITAPMLHSVKTRWVFKLIDSTIGGVLDNAEFLFVLNKIRTVTNAYIKQILESQHNTWLNKSGADAIMQYWQSSDFHARLDKIEEGLNLGHYV